MEDILKIFDLTVQDGRMILVCAILFAIFIRLLSRSLFDPIVALMDARDAASTGALTEAAQVEQAAADLDKNREHKVAGARAEFMKHKTERLTQAKQDAEALIHQAEEQAQKLLEDARSQIQLAQKDLQAHLEQKRGALVQATIDQIVGAVTQSA